MYTTHYSSPLGKLLLAGDGEGLAGLWFEGQAHFPRLDAEEKADLPLFGEVRRWLDIYFSGREPDFTPSLRPRGTDFQRAVWGLLGEIPYGRTATYGELAARLAGTSARAVGGAVGRNPVSILIPCHRVVGAGGCLTGYAGGLDKKGYLLRLEGAPVEEAARRTGPSRR